MIDLHSHILPGIDDGAKAPRHAIQMLQAAAAAGIGTIAATSHYSPTGDVFYDEVLQKLKLEAAPLGIRLLAGTEYDYGFIDQLPLEQLRTYEGTHALLIDMKSSYLPPNGSNFFFRLKLAGLQLVIAHPERLWTSQIEEATRTLLNDRDLVLQLNSGSLLGCYGKRVQKAAYYLLDHGFCHLIANDAHHRTQFKLQDAFDHLQKQYPRNELEEIFLRNPQRLLDGKRLHRFTPPSSFKEQTRRRIIRFFE